MMKRLTPAVLAAALLTVTASAGAEPSAEEWKIEKFDWTGPLADATQIVITNPYGDVRCRATDGSEVVIVANIQRHRGDPRRAAVDVVRASAGQDTHERLAITVGYPPEAQGESVTPEMAKRRVDVTVLVPHAARLAIETTTGLIEAKGASSHVRAETRIGDVVVKTSGSVFASSQHGAITVTFSSTSWDEDATSLKTLTGDISVWLTPEASVTVEAETRGELSTDYSIEIERRLPDDKKYAVARIGGAANRLSVKTEKGRVRLFRSQF